ncbi:MAG: UDP-N-acetylglucosamine 1-carboxyvinyltransferase [Lachnospiraceae bacterium]|nr:UDP-N-acetylglucosamine 1-carboxyvinyltransferase [Lachnospiraceae bacterium]
MDCIKITGPNHLCGEVDIQGSKNAALPLLAATVMLPGVSVVHNCPRIADIYYMIRILEHLGCRVHWEENSLVIDASDICNTQLPPEYVKAMRCAIVLIGPMLARKGEISLPYPGGCVIGKRPIDLHRKALAQLGAHFEERADLIRVTVQQLKGSRIHMNFPSVGATQNAILAAVTAKGKTAITGGACEPEVIQLAEYLRKAGAQIQVTERGGYEIEGVERLHAVEATVPSDRIVAGTYLLATAATHGHITLSKAPTGELTKVIGLLTKAGAECRLTKDTIELDAGGGLRPVPYVETQVYPGFPTDLQSPLLATLALAEGVSCIREKIFENRFEVVKQLRRMGADIQVQDDLAVICGVKYLRGCPLKAGDLRSGAALVIAGLCGEGVTTIEECHYIERGYEDICRDIRCLGGDIKRQCSA